MWSTAGPSDLRYAAAAAPAAGSPTQSTGMPRTGLPRSSGGTKGSGGAVITAQPVDSSSGAASAPVAPRGQDLSRPAHREHHQPGQNNRPQLVQPELEL